MLLIVWHKVQDKHCADIWSLLGRGKSSTALRDDQHHSKTFEKLNSVWSKDDRHHSNTFEKLNSSAGEPRRSPQPTAQPREQRPR